jgi:hypothetical protein
MIEVYHRKQPTFMFYTSEDMADHRAAWDADGYEKVATIEAVPAGWRDAEEYAFYITNSIDCPWVDNPGVAPIGRQHRSTSVGDVVKLSDGELLVCAPSGFQPLNL